MIDTLQVRILSALKSCLRPLARALLRSGIGYQQFAEVAKTAFVEEAMLERDNRGRVKNTSRVSIRTGLSRKEVARIKRCALDDAQAGASKAQSLYRSNVAARVLQLWHVDSRFGNFDGTPKQLPMGGAADSFTSLVRLAGGDVPPGAVRAELLAAGAIAESPEGELSPLQRYFVPSDAGEDLLIGLTHIVEPVLQGLAHNTGPLKTVPFVQRLAYSDCLTSDTILTFRHFATNRSEEFLGAIDDWLGTHEARCEATEVKRTRVGLGVFYYEGTPADADGDGRFPS